MSDVVRAFHGEVTQAGKLVLDDRLHLQRHIRSLAGERVTLTVERYHPQRTNRQSRYYFGVVVKLLAEHCGYDDLDEMHETLAMKFLRIDDCPITGVPRRKRTPKTNTKEFAEYLDQCIRLAAELGVVIPEPRQVVSR